MKKTYKFFWSGIYSQWHMADFVDEYNVKYNCAEQYMMASKTKIFKDEEALKKIMASSDPREQKALGRKVKRKTRLGKSISKEDRAKHKYIANMINGILSQAKNKEKENDNNNPDMAIGS